MRIKPLRSALVGVAVVAVLLLALVALVFSSSAQTWAARKVLAAQPDMKGEVGRVSAGLQKVEASQLRIERPGMILTAPSVKVELPVMSAAGEKVEIRRLEAKGWVLDLTAPVPVEKKGSFHRVDPAIRAMSTRLAALGLAQVPMAAAVETKADKLLPVAFEGIFRLLNLPVDFSLNEADVAGEIIFPTAPGQPPGRALLTLTGGQLGSGKEGRFTLSIDAKMTGAAAPVSRVKLEGVIDARMDTPRSFQQLAMRADIVATGSKFPQGARLSTHSLATRDPQAENYSFELKSLADGSPKTLVALKAAYPAGAKSVGGTWALDLANSDIAAFTLGHTLPDFTAVGEGKLTANASFDEMQASGKLAATLENLNSIRPELTALGRLKLNADFDVVQRGDVIQVSRLGTELVGASPVASVVALQPIEFNPRTREVKANGSADLLRIHLQGVPLAWAQPFLTGYEISGGDARGDFMLRNHEGGVTLRPAAPFTVTNLTVSQSGTPVVRGLDIAANVSANYAPQGWQADVGDLSVRAGGSTLLTLAVKAAQPSGEGQPLKATGHYSADLPALLAQPVGAGLAKLSKGRAHGSFSAEVRPTLQKLGVAVELSDLVSAAQQPLAKISANVRADVHPQGSISAEIPIAVEHTGRKSDVLLTATIKPDGARQSVDAQIVSNELHVQDVQGLLVVIEGTPEGKTPPSKPPEKKPASPAQPPQGPPPSPAKEVPPWDAFTGQIKLAMKKLIYPPDVVMTDVVGAVKITPEALVLEEIRAMVSPESQARIDANIRFNATHVNRYSIGGNVNVPGFNPAPILRAAAPDKEPTVDGIFDVTGQFTGVAPTTAQLGEAVTGSLKLAAKSGTFRALALSPEKHAMIQKIANPAVNALLGIIGDKAGSGAAYAKLALDIALATSAIKFDQLNAELVKDGPNTAIKNFTLISPELRMAGEGSIQYQPGVAIYKQPLVAQINLFAQGGLGDAMKKLGLLKPEADPLNYFPLNSPVVLEGSLAKITSDKFAQLLLEKLAGSSVGRGLEGLLRGDR